MSAYAALLEGALLPLGDRLLGQHMMARLRFLRAPIGSGASWLWHIAKSPSTGRSLDGSPLPQTWEAFQSSPRRRSGAGILT